MRNKWFGQDVHVDRIEFRKDYFLKNFEKKKRPLNWIFKASPVCQSFISNSSTFFVSPSRLWSWFPIKFNMFEKCFAFNAYLSSEIDHNEWKCQVNNVIIMKTGKFLKAIQWKQCFHLITNETTRLCIYIRCQKYPCFFKSYNYLGRYAPSKKGGGVKKLV